MQIKSGNNKMEQSFGYKSVKFTSTTDYWHINTSLGVKRLKHKTKKENLLFYK